MVAAACRIRCDHTVDVANLGDPSLGVTKRFAVTYRFGAEPTGAAGGTRTLLFAAEASGQTVHLTCGAFDGNLGRLVGNYRTLVPDAIVPAASTATISLVDASTIKFTRSDGYSWHVTQTPDQRGTLQLEIVEGVQLFLGFSSVTITLDPDGNVRGLLRADGNFFARP